MYVLALYGGKVNEEPITIRKTTLQPPLFTPSSLHTRVHARATHSSPHLPCKSQSPSTKTKTTTKTKIKRKRKENENQKKTKNETKNETKNKTKNEMKNETKNDKRNEKRNKNKAKQKQKEGWGAPLLRGPLSHLKKKTRERVPALGCETFRDGGACFPP